MGDRYRPRGLGWASPSEAFPRLRRVGTYANARDVLRKSDDELAELRHRKLAILYIGLESGDDAVLGSVEKGATVASSSTSTLPSPDAFRSSPSFCGACDPPARSFARSPYAASSLTPRGSRTVKHVPSWADERTSMLPPCASTI